MSMASSIVFITFEGPGPTQFLTTVVNVAVLALCVDKPVTVYVLPISDTSLANVPGKSLPLVIATLIASKLMFVVVPSVSVITNVDSAPVSSVKNSSFSFFGSDILNTALSSKTTSVNVLVWEYMNSSKFINV